MSDHAIVHVEFSANDLDATSTFYGEIFGWKIQQPPGFEGYRLFEAPGGPGGGFPKVDNQMVRAGQVLVYISTDDIDATLARVASLGGKTVVPKTEIPGMGWFGIFTDPTGNHVGLYSGH